MGDGYALTRVRYFGGMYLCTDDFRTEQDYHIYSRRLLHSGVFTAGVIDGLTVTLDPEAAPAQVSVTSGRALDVNGALLLLADDAQVEVGSVQQGATYSIIIKFAQTDAGGGPVGEASARIVERPVVASVARPPEGAEVLLATIRVVDGKLAVDPAWGGQGTRRHAGAILGSIDFSLERASLPPLLVPPDVTPISIAARGYAQGDSPVLEVTAPYIALYGEVSACGDSLAVDGDLTVEGAARIEGALTADTSAQIQGELTVEAGLNVTGGASADTLVVGPGAAAEGATLTVNGVSALGGDATVAGTLTASGSADIKGELTADKGLEVTGGASADTLVVGSGSASEGAALTVNGKSALGGDTTVTGNLTADGSADIKGALTADKGLGVTGGASADTLVVGAGPATAGAALTVNGRSALDGDTSVTGNVTASGNVTAAKFIGDGSQLKNLPAGASSSLWQQSGRNVYYTSGNVGIGESSPSSLLTVKGGAGSRIGSGLVTLGAASGEGYTLSGYQTSFDKEIQDGNTQYVLTFGAIQEQEVQIASHEGAGRLTLTEPFPLSVGWCDFKYRHAGGAVQSPGGRFLAEGLTVTSDGADFTRVVPGDMLVISRFVSNSNDQWQVMSVGGKTSAVVKNLTSPATGSAPPNASAFAIAASQYAVSVMGGASVDTLDVTGTLSVDTVDAASINASGNAKVSGTMEVVGSLTAGPADIQGDLEVDGAMRCLGSIDQRVVTLDSGSIIDNTVASTDGFLLCVVSMATVKVSGFQFPVGDSGSGVRIGISTGSGQYQTTARFKSNSLAPVPKGATFSATVIQGTTQKYNNTGSVTWIPSGGASQAINWAKQSVSFAEADSNSTGAAEQGGSRRGLKSRLMTRFGRKMPMS